MGLNMRVGNTQSVSASVYGTPKPKITWYKDGRKLVPQQAKVDTTEFGTQITLKDVDISAAGNYRVVVENDAGSDSAEVNVNVKGQFQLIPCHTHT